MDFIYLKSTKTYIRVSDVSQVKPVFNGQIVVDYELTLAGDVVVADAAIDGDLIHDSILGIPKDINHP